MGDRHRQDMPRRRWPPTRTPVIRHEAEKAFGKEFAEALRILYGGSVKPDNASALMGEEEIDGALVGGASLDPAGFTKIVKY